MIVCRICRQLIREVPGKEGMIFEDVCDACKAGKPPLPQKVLQIPPPAARAETGSPEVLEGQGLEASFGTGTTKDTFLEHVIRAAAHEVAREILLLVQAGLKASSCDCAKEVSDESDSQ